MVEDIDAETPLTVLTFQRCARTGFWGHQKPISNRLYQPQAILSRWYDKFILWFRISKLVIFLLMQIRSNKLIECFRMFSLKIRIIYWIAILLVMIIFCPFLSMHSDINTQMDEIYTFNKFNVWMNRALKLMWNKMRKMDRSLERLYPM